MPPLLLLYHQRHLVYLLALGRPLRASHQLFEQVLLLDEV